MSPICKPLRVFISSTFREVHAERDHLVTLPVPELRERVEQLGFEFFDLNLRWGLPAKALNGATANSWAPGSAAGNGATGSRHSSSASSANAKAGCPNRATSAPPSTTTLPNRGSPKRASMLRE